MYFHQPETNVIAHGMSSAEEAKYRYWDADPENLQDPFVVATEAEQRKAREQQSQRFVDMELGRLSLFDTEMVGE